MRRVLLCVAALRCEARATGLLLAVALAAVCGCTESTRSDADRFEDGRVYVLSGAGGMMGECDRIRDGLKQAGVRRPIEFFHWSRGGVFEDQTGIEANRKKARQLARRIEAFKRVSPGSPVHLIGVSAGTGLVVWALEDLQPGVNVTAAILISSSLDTQYDLSKAMKKTEDGIYSFNSMADTVLSLGVTWAGTVDRNGALAGGLVGFSPRADASEETRRLYKEKLHEIPWWPGDAVLGHLGDHLGATNPAYVKEKVAPIVLGKEPPPPPEEAPLEAVRGVETADGQPDKDAEPAGSAEPETPGAKQRSAVEKQVEKARRDLRRRSRAGDGSDRGRFHDWQVAPGGGARAGTVEPLEEADFFARPERLP